MGEIGLDLNERRDLTLDAVVVDLRPPGVERGVLGHDALRARSEQVPRLHYLLYLSRRR
jgi:hypothetical protein